MSEQKSWDGSKREITFPNGNRAQLVAPSANASPTDIVKTLDIAKPKAVIIITGGAAKLDDELKPHLVQLFSRGIARVAVETGALIMDGGTQAGVMAIMGQGVADRGRKSTLLGIAPAGKVTYPDGRVEQVPQDAAPLDPNHSHFVLVDSQEWGGETDTMYELAATLAKDVPAVTVLVNGGDIARNEVLRSVRQRWPVIVIEGSGRLADEIAGLWQEKPAFIPDAVMAEIIEDGDIHLFALDGAVAGLERLLEQLISRYSDQETPLKLAWQRFALYDANAGRQQKNFKRLRVWILVLGVLGTLLALSQTQLNLSLSGFNGSLGNQVLHYVIIVVPIAVAILIAAANRFSAGNKWVLLRGSAEAIKREIYRYRTRAEIYSKQQTTQVSAEAKLMRQVENIGRRLMQTEVNLSALQPYDGPIPPKMYGTAAEDDGLSYLTPDKYLNIRLGDQLNYYRLKTTRLEKQLMRLQWLTYIAGGAGTLLAAIGLELWIALTTALVTAFAAYLEYQQVENTLVKYNQALTDLANVRGWWLALPPEAQALQTNIDKLVSHTEKILQTELTGWVQEMQDALAELRAGEREQEEGQPQTAGSAGKKA